MSEARMTLGRTHLHDLAAGHPLAMQGLREYEAVITAARKLVGGDPSWAKQVMGELYDKLKAGGFIE